MSTGSLKGAIGGGLSGGVFSGIDVGFGGQYSAKRVLVDATAGGSLSALQGGEFGKGFVLSGASAGSEYAYREIVKYGSEWRPGEGEAVKSEKSMPNQGKNNVGIFSPDPAKIKYALTSAKVNSPLSRFLNQIPGVNAVAGMHDVFQAQLPDNWVRNAINIPRMPVAATMTYPALLRGGSSVLIANQDY
ncbi:MAG: hypothetical protein HC774_07330 [Sphingomonadales bacterium]|nr:hypothetical protein [Sphingomonadales bacterium]